MQEVQYTSKHAHTHRHTQSSEQFHTNTRISSTHARTHILTLTHTHTRSLPPVIAQGLRAHRQGTQLSLKHTHTHAHTHTPVIAQGLRAHRQGTQLSLKLSLAGIGCFLQQSRNFGDSCQLIMHHLSANHASSVVVHWLLKLKHYVDTHMECNQVRLRFIETASPRAKLSHTHNNCHTNDHVHWCAKSRNT